MNPDHLEFRKRTLGQPRGEGEMKVQCGEREVNCGGKGRGRKRKERLK